MMAKLSYLIPNGPTTANSEFAYGIISYWGLVLIVGIGNRVVQAVRDLKHSTADSKSQSKSTWIRRHLLLPRAFGNHHQLPFDSPTRVEALLIALYVIMNFVFCFPLHQVNHEFSPTVHREAVGQSVAARMGTLTVANIPIIWLFAQRNPLLQWLTGWSYATFSQFHRWAARTATLLAISHAICFTVVRTWQGQYHKIWTFQFTRFGAAAVVSMSILVATSTFFVRKRNYELFLVIHFVFALAVLIFVWYHVKFQKTAFNNYLYVAFGIWAFDRMLRWGRMLWLSAKPNLTGVKATASYDEDADLIRLDTTDFLKDHTPIPGAYYYIYEPGRLRGYESHPFTLMSCTRPAVASRKDSSSTTSSPNDRPEKDLETGMTKELALTEALSLQDRNTELETRHTFLIRPLKGFTDQLRQKMLSIDGKRKVKSTRIMLEGPYVVRIPLHRYSTVVMIVGGVGITAAVSQARALLSGPRTPLVRLIWSTQRQETVDDVCENELQDLLRHPRLKVEVYLTQTQALAEKETSYAAHIGRPAIPTLLEEERQQCQGSMAVFVCGPKTMEQATRNAVIDMAGTEGPRVSFYQERFGW